MCVALKIVLFKKLTKRWWSHRCVVMEDLVIVFLNHWNIYHTGRDRLFENKSLIIIINTRRLNYNWSEHRTYLSHHNRFQYMMFRCWCHLWGIQFEKNSTNNLCFSDFYENSTINFYMKILGLYSCNCYKKFLIVWKKILQNRFLWRLLW